MAELEFQCPNIIQAIVSLFHSQLNSYKPQLCGKPWVVSQGWYAARSSGNTSGKPAYRLSRFPLCAVFSAPVPTYSNCFCCLELQSLSLQQSISTVNSCILCYDSKGFPRQTSRSIMAECPFFQASESCIACYLKPEGPCLIYFVWFHGCLRHETSLVPITPS